MHAAAKVMLVLGAVLCAIGAGIWIMGAESIDEEVETEEEVEEAVGGVFAIMGSWMVLCCGASFLLLGGIFALTLNEGGRQMVVVQQQMPGMVVPAVTQMSDPQYEQPVQYQAPVQEMQPPQGGL